MAPVNSTGRGGRPISTAQAVLALAADVHRTHELVHATYRRHRESEAAAARWSAAAGEARAAVDAFETHVATIETGLRAATPAAVDAALGFLEAEPWCFRSGYAKARLMRLLASMSLGPKELGRVAYVVLRAVDGGPRLEFTDTLRLARRAGVGRLGPDLRRRLHGDDRARAWRAMVVLTHLARPALSETDRRRIRALVWSDLRSQFETSEYPATSWSERAARRVFDDEWAEDLLRLAQAAGPDRAAARRLLDACRHGTPT